MWAGVRKEIEWKEEYLSKSDCIKHMMLKDNVENSIHSTERRFEVNYRKK